MSQLYAHRVYSRSMYLGTISVLVVVKTTTPKDEKYLLNVHYSVGLANYKGFQVHKDLNKLQKFQSDNHLSKNKLPQLAICDINEIPQINSIDFSFKKLITKEPTPPRIVPARLKLYRYVL